MQAASGRLRSSVVILEIVTEVAASDVGPYSAPGSKYPRTSADRSKAIQELPETKALSQGVQRKTSASRTWAKPLGAPEDPSTPRLPYLGPLPNRFCPAKRRKSACFVRKHLRGPKRKRRFAKANALDMPSHRRHRDHREKIPNPSIADCGFGIGGNRVKQSQFRRGRVGRGANAPNEPNSSSADCGLCKTNPIPEQVSSVKFQVLSRRSR